MDGRRRTRPGDPMTARQREVLEIIRAYRRDRGLSPTCREIGAVLGVRSVYGVFGHLRSLVKKGYLTAPAGGRARSYLIPDDPDDREALRAGLRLVLDRLAPVPSAEPEEGAVGFIGYFSRAEVEHLAAVHGPEREGGGEP